MSVETMQELLIDELKDLYSAEKQIVRALPKLAKAASSPELQQALLGHLEETKGQVGRLEKIGEIDAFYMRQFGRFIEKLSQTSDTDGNSLLQNSMIVYGSGNADALAQAGGHDLHDLGQRADRGLGHAGDRGVRGGLQPDGERHGLLVVEHHGW